MCCSSFDIKECHLTAFTILSMFSFLASSLWFAEIVLMGHLTGCVDLAHFCISVFAYLSLSVFPAGWQKLRLFWRDIWLLADWRFWFGAFQRAAACSGKPFLEESNSKSGAICSLFLQPLRGWRPFILWPSPLIIIIAVNFYQQI